jgi:hypothetical protein
MSIDYKRSLSDAGLLPWVLIGLSLVVAAVIFFKAL